MTAIAPSYPHPTGYRPPQARLWHVAGRAITVVPPSIRDPRVHLSMVILTIHVLGQIWLGFRVSLVQIGVTLLTCAAIELAITIRRTGTLVWPASALLTGTGISLVFRVIGTENGDLWSWTGWYWFAAVAAVSLLTKYVIRYQGSHVFNPSNLGLVVAFIVLGSSRVEPLDFWWGPLGLAMMAAYLVIGFGGLSIGGRLDLLGMGVAFWLALAGGIAVLAALDHSITARWSFTPVTGLHFWWIIVTSPEVMIFLFFMITDPRTVPSGRVGRVAFGLAVGVVCTLLIAPHETEFGAKVGLLAGLVILCALRPAFDRAFPEKGSADDHLGPYLRQLFTGHPTTVNPGRLVTRSGAALALAVVVGLGIAAAGTPARVSATEPPPVELSPAAVDVAALPTVTIDPQVASLSAALATPAGAQELAETLAFNLSVEAEALQQGDPTLLPAVDDGARLFDLEDVIAASLVSGERTIPGYTFDSLHLTVVFPGGFQRGANAGLVAEGTVDYATYAPSGELLDVATEPFAYTFSMRSTTTGRWLTTDTLDPTP